MQRYSALNSSIGLKGELAPEKPAIVEFNPPPAISSNGKPEPASSKWMRTPPFSKTLIAVPPCPAACANTRGAAAIAVAAAPVVSMVRLIGSIIGVLLDQMSWPVRAARTSDFCGAILTTRALPFQPSGEFRLRLLQQEACALRVGPQQQQPEQSRYDQDHGVDGEAGEITLHRRRGVLDHLAHHEWR